MFNRFTLIWLILVGAAGMFLFRTSEQVQNKEEELAHLHKAIFEEQEAIRTTRAELSYLNDIERVEMAARRFLPQLRPTAGDQLQASLETLPLRPMAPSSPSLTPSSPLVPLPSAPVLVSTPPAGLVAGGAIPAVAATATPPDEDPEEGEVGNSALNDVKSEIRKELVAVTTPVVVPPAPRPKKPGTMPALAGTVRPAAGGGNGGVRQDDALGQMLIKMGLGR